MGVGELSKIIFLILISSVKFVAGPVFAFYDQKHDFTFFERVLYPLIGGMLGVVVFTYFTDTMVTFWHWIKRQWKKFKSKSEVFSEPEADVEGNVEINYSYIEKTDQPVKKKKVFSARSRRIVAVWQRFGIVGLAFITPVILSIPIGTIVASRLIHRKRKIFLFMFISIAFWSLIMSSAFELYHVMTIKALQKEIMSP